MRNECNIIQDLLPLYMEGIVSEDTDDFIEEHLNSCTMCKDILENMKSSEGVKISDFDDVESEVPLKIIKDKLMKKKMILICSAVVMTLAAVFCVSVLMELFIYQEKIAVNGVIYMQSNGEIFDLPEGSTEIGYVRGISHRSTADPMGDFMATNIDEKYGGSPVYRSGENEETIFLEDYSGYFIPFIKIDS